MRGGRHAGQHLPDRSYERTAAYLFITGNQCDPLSPGGGTDKPINRIFRKILRKLSGKGRDLRSNWLHIDARPSYKMLNRVFDCAVCPKGAAGEEKR